jgi:hypothetical protein
MQSLTYYAAMLITCCFTFPLAIFVYQNYKRAGTIVELTCGSWDLSIVRPLQILLDLNIYKLKMARLTSKQSVFRVAG